MFVGLRGQMYQVHGVSGQVYNLIVDSRTLTDAMRMNARFVFLASGRCPLGVPGRGCWSHPGSYLQEIGVWTAAGDRLVIISGGYQQGFTNVTLNGYALEPGTASIPLSSLSLQFPSPFVSKLTVGNFHIEMHNSGRFINLNRVAVKQWSQLNNTHGLLGQTWRLKQAKGKDVNEVEGYLVRGRTESEHLKHSSTRLERETTWSTQHRQQQAGRVGKRIDQREQSTTGSSASE